MSFEGMHKFHDALLWGAKTAGSGLPSHYYTHYYTQIHPVFGLLVNFPIWQEEMKCLGELMECRNLPWILSKMSVCQYFGSFFIMKKKHGKTANNANVDSRHNNAAAVNGQEVAINIAPNNDKGQVPNSNDAAHADH